MTEWQYCYWTTLYTVLSSVGNCALTSESYDQCLSAQMACVEIYTSCIKTKSNIRDLWVFTQVVSGTIFMCQTFWSTCTCSYTTILLGQCWNCSSHTQCESHSKGTQVHWQSTLQSGHPYNLTPITQKNRALHLHSTDMSMFTPWTLDSFWHLTLWTRNFSDTLTIVTDNFAIHQHNGQ